MTPAFKTQNLQRAFLASIAILSAVAVLLPQDTRAEIVIDDFVDSVHINLPAQKLQSFVTNNVGDLGADRSISANFFQTQPNGFVDVNQTMPGVLTANIPTTQHTNTSPDGAFNIVYGLSDVDLTQSNLNNAVILGFGKLSSALPQCHVEVSVMRYGQVGTSFVTSYYSSGIDLTVANSNPFSLVFPFQSFHVARGAAQPDFNFASIRQIGVFIDLGYGLPESLKFEMALERVRVGQSVPEPSTGVYCAVFFILLFNTRPKQFTTNPRD